MSDTGITVPVSPRRSFRRSPWKWPVLALAAAAAILLLAAGGYLTYVLTEYYRIEDNLELEISGSAGTAEVPVGRELSIISYNIGFAAYTPEFGFFMDGGDESRAFSRQSVLDTLDGITALLSARDADFLLLEEVDVRATRSHEVDQCAILTDGLSGYVHNFAVNYDSPYLLYPFSEPHGESLAGMLTMAKYGMVSALRRSLPVEKSLMKLIDLDRCYTVTRFDTDNGRQLVLYTVHLSAYTSDGSIATQQLEMLLDDMAAEYESGSYVVCGGDFNKDLLGDSSGYFGVSGEEYTWAQRFPEELLADTGIDLFAPLEDFAPVPSCRNADGPYRVGQFVLTVDGFLVSENVSVTDSYVINTGFAYSDHNPVTMTFTLDP